MAGNFENNISKKPSRKKWTLLRGRGLFQRVGTEMAEDGNPDAQFNLASELLEKRCDSPTEEIENAREGIYWLVKASEQDHVEATNLLKTCLETGKGITEHNVSEVVDCLDMTRNEKLSVKAMRDLFMNFSQGEEFITSNQLISKLREVERSAIRSDKSQQIETKNLQLEDWKERASTSASSKLTEDLLVSAAKTYARGNVPDIGQSLVLPERTVCKSNSVNAVYRFLLFPYVLDALYSYLLSFNLNVISTLFYVSPAQLKLLLLLFVYSTFKFETIFVAVPTLVYYLSIICMIAATCQVLHYRQRFRQFRCWSNLFLRYGGENFSSEEAEFMHCRNGLTAYVCFFVFLIVNLFVQSSSSVKSFFQAEITFVAFLFTIITLFSFTLSKSRYMTRTTRIDYLSLFSFMLHVLAKYPYESDSVVGEGWRFMDLQVPTFASYVVGHGIEFCLNFRAFFYLIIPAVLVKIGARHNGRGVYSDLIPHCVTLSWWQLTLIYAQDATWYSLIRPALALVGIVFFPPLTALATIFLPAYAIIEYVYNYENLHSVLVTTIFALVFSTIVLRKVLNLGSRSWSIFTVFRISITIIAVILLAFNTNGKLWSNLKKATETNTLDVSEFVSYCNSFQTTYSDAEKIESTLVCSQTVGLRVRWNGRVMKTKITNIHNPVASIVDKLPTVLSRYARCVLGEEYPLCSDSFRVEFCKTLTDACHLNNWNSYEFEIQVEILVNGGYHSLPVTLRADSNFYNFSRKLNVDDDVWFSGTIVGDNNGLVKGDSPNIRLDSIACVTCIDTELTESKNNVELSVQHLYNFTKYLLNFFFNPLIVFR